MQRRKLIAPAAIHSIFRADRRSMKRLMNMHGIGVFSCKGGAGVSHLFCFLVL